MIARSRRYEQGTPLALSIADIESYLELHDSPVELHVFVECVLMLDNLFLDQAYKKKWVVLSHFTTLLNMILEFKNQ